VKSRNEGVIVLDLAYEYYKSKGGELEWEDFKRLLLLWIELTSPSWVNYFKHFDSEFQVMKVIDAKGRIVKFL
jgi:hypothetical protein